MPATCSWRTRRRAPRPSTSRTTSCSAGRVRTGTRSPKQSKTQSALKSASSSFSAAYGSTRTPRSTTSPWPKARSRRPTTCSNPYSTSHRRSTARRYTAWFRRREPGRENWFVGSGGRTKRPAGRAPSQAGAHRTPVGAHDTMKRGPLIVPLAPAHLVGSRRVPGGSSAARWSMSVLPLCRWPCSFSSASPLPCSRARAFTSP